jgi:Fe-S-cluster containining protein
MVGMDAEELYRDLAQALRRAEERADRNERELQGLRAQLDQLMEVLVGRGLLAEGHPALLAKVGALSARAAPPKVRLRTYVDKYQLQGPDIDCASLMHLCRARCCSLSFELTTQDLDEGGVLWEVNDPYVIRHERDGYCSHLDRATGGCGVYERRPATCRGFDCRGDRRIWLDFERGIPAPLFAGLAPIAAGTKAGE